jgi:cell division protein FtsN
MASCRDAARWFQALGRCAGSHAHRVGGRGQDPHPAGSYVVQVASQRSEAGAQAAFRNLQAKYASQLGGRHALIHKVELGAKGTYYRAMVGPFATANEAGELCSGLKAAGGQCIVQKN